MTARKVYFFEEMSSFWKVDIFFVQEFVVMYTVFSTVLYVLCPFVYFISKNALIHRILLETQPTGLWMTVVQFTPASCFAAFARSIRAAIVPARMSWSTTVAATSLPPFCE